MMLLISQNAFIYRDKIYDYRESHRELIRREIGGIWTGAYAALDLDGSYFTCGGRFISLNETCILKFLYYLHAKNVHFVEYLLSQEEEKCS